LPADTARCSASCRRRRSRGAGPLKRNADGSLTLYAGARAPGKDKESSGKKAILDGSWKPPVIKAVN